VKRWHVILAVVAAAVIVAYVAMIVGGNVFANVHR
jgi:hypothetical protein